ncbi:unnamed protein product [Timema podura]|uniref:Uncharacterized protein n=2 Tax=Timema TaxID=61471 RepID=A0ABN7PSS8_TIMPD|nr:unnamed protein product [Timema podura]
MKWRHTKEGKSQGGERPDSTQEPHISVDS